MTRHQQVFLDIVMKDAHRLLAGLVDDLDLCLVADRKEALLLDRIEP